MVPAPTTSVNKFEHNQSYFTKKLRQKQARLDTFSMVVSEIIQSSIRCNFHTIICLKLCNLLVVTLKLFSPVLDIALDLASSQCGHARH